MQKRAGGTRGGRVGLIAAIAAVLCLGVAAMAMANNLDRRTATNAAKFAAKKECQQTTGCTDFFVRRLHRVSRHKAIGKIAVVGARQGVRFVCVRGITIHLDHFTGDITYTTTARRCQTA
jgi:hypothetical protein